VTAVPGSGGLELHVVERPVATAALDGEIPEGTRSLSVFLVNNRRPSTERADLAYAFQAELVLECELPFVPRPDLRGAFADDWDDRVADLHYADTPEYATGHGTAADWELEDGECRLLRTRWVPTAEVEKTVAGAIAGVELRMSVLGELAGGGAVASALAPLVSAYREWIATQRSSAESLSGRRRETAEQLLHLAGFAADRAGAGSSCSPPTQTCSTPSGWPTGPSRVRSPAGSMWTSPPGGRSSSRSSCSTSRAWPTPTTRTARRSTSCTSRPAAARPRRTWA
jgi:hypothetical protein